MNASRQGTRVLIAGSVLQLFLGIIYVWSVFVIPVSTAFDWSVDSAKLTSSYMLCCFVLGILLGGKVQATTGTQPVILAGGLLMALGMLLTSFLGSGAPWAIYITYGVLGGLGVGMVYNAIITSAQKWFPQKRGLATGISVCAFGFSAVIFAPLVEALIARFDVTVTFRILSAVFAVVAVALFSLIELPQAGFGSAVGADQLTQKQYTTSEILRTRSFYFITLSLMLGTAAYFILNPSFKTLSLERGLSAGIGTALVMITGIANSLGRLVVPLLSDRIGREKAAIVILCATGLCALLLSVAGGVLFLAAVAVIAFCYGGYSGIYPLITADYFGITNVGSNYGAVMVGFAMSALFFPMLAAGVANVTARFILLGGVALAGAVLVTLLLRGKAKAAQ